jgi:hypothetical protein
LPLYRRAQLADDLDGLGLAIIGACWVEAKQAIEQEAINSVDNRIVISRTPVTDQFVLAASIRC